MTSRSLISPAELERALSSMPKWKHHSNALERTFQFKDFSEAFAFMTRVAFFAEKLDHHPDWTNVYNRVSVRLNTHDVGGVTALDFELAQKIDSLA